MSWFKKGVDKIIKTEEQIAVEQAANLLVKQEAEQDHIDVRKEYMKEIKEIIQTFTELQDNWDGLGAIPLTTESKDNAYLILDAIGIEPEDCYPNPHGTLSLEYTKNNTFLSVEIGSKAFSYYTRNGEYVNFQNSKEFNDKNLKEIKHYLYEIHTSDIWNDEKREAIKEAIKKHRKDV